MDLRVPSRAWPQPPQGEGGGARPRERPWRAAGPAEPFVLDLEPIVEGIPLPRPPSPGAGAGGGGLPHRGRLIDIRI